MELDVFTEALVIICPTLGLMVYGLAVAARPDRKTKKVDTREARQLDGTRLAVLALLIVSMAWLGERLASISPTASWSWTAVAVFGAFDAIFTRDWVKLYRRLHPRLRQFNPEGMFFGGPPVSEKIR